MPVINMYSAASTLFPQCFTDTNFGHTLFVYSSALTWVRGRHIWKFGGEQRIFFNNFWQPNPPTGNFDFPTTVTEQTINGGDDTQGDSFGDILFGAGDTGNRMLDTYGPVRNKTLDVDIFIMS